MRHPLKRRRVGSAGHALSRVVTPPDTDESDGEHCAESSGSQRLPLTSEFGQQVVNRGKAKRRHEGRKTKGDEAGVNTKRDVFAATEDDLSSPRKRKRGVQGSGSEGDTGSWVEMEEDEEEPEFIAESERSLRALNDRTMAEASR